MAVQTSVGLIETYFVSMLGTDALAGMALVKSDEARRNAEPQAEHHRVPRQNSGLRLPVRTQRTGAATTYASIVFGGAVLIWLFNALSAVIRGTGNMVLPAIVTCVGYCMAATHGSRHAVASHSARSKISVRSRAPSFRPLWPS
jgi:hypothetical protein